MAVSLGPFMTCFLAVLFLTVYIYIVIYVKKDILYSGMKLVFVGIALILIRMLVPFNFPFTQTIVSYKILPPINEFLFNYIGDTRIDLATILFIIWIAVTIVKILRLIWNQMQYRACLLPFVIKDWSKYAQLANVLKKCNASFWQVCIVPTQISPAVVGIRKPILVLPDYQFSEHDLYYICRHETEHCRNHDLWLNLFLDLVICTQWFNPLVYFMQKELTLAFELSNDRVILNTMDERQRTEYAECVMKMVRYQGQKPKRANIALSFAQTDHSNVRTRVLYIMSRKKRTNIAGKLSVVFNSAIVALVIVVSFVYVPEAYCSDTLEKENSVYTKSEDAFFVKANDKYELYLYGESVLSFSYIPDDFKDIPVIIEEESE